MTEVPQGVRDRIQQAALRQAQAATATGKGAYDYDIRIFRKLTVEEMTTRIQQAREAEWLAGVKSMKLVPL